MRNFLQASDQPVPHSTHVLYVRLHIPCSLFYGCSHTRDSRYIFRSRTFAAFLCTALNQIGKADTLPGIQKTDSLRPVKFMCRGREHIDIICLYINGQMCYCLYCVRMEQYTVLFTDFSDFSNRLNSSYFVVGEHNCYKTGIVPNSFFQFLHPYEAIFMDIQQRYLEAFSFHSLQSMKNSMVFKSGRDNVHLSVLFSDFSCRADCLVICFAAA